MTADEPQWEPWMKRMLNEIKEKFINDRVNGFKHPKSGEWYGPVTRAEAEARWKKKEPEYRRGLLTDPEWREIAERTSAGEEWKSDEPGSSNQPQKTVPPVPVEQQSTKIMPGVRNWNVSQDELLKGMHQLTHDDLIDMWQKAKTMPKRQQQKAIRYITHLSRQLESEPARMLVNILLEATF